MRRLGGSFCSEEIGGDHLEGKEIEGGHSGEVRRLRGVILVKWGD